MVDDGWGSTYFLVKQNVNSVFIFLHYLNLKNKRWIIKTNDKFIIKKIYKREVMEIYFCNYKYVNYEFNMFLFFKRWILVIVTIILFIIIIIIVLNYVYV